ncbi:MAG: iron ABC transporter permease [Chloroflexi bacterium]|nr:iron ABC transporter permease [Chloroflexota bacterium]
MSSIRVPFGSPIRRLHGVGGSRAAVGRTPWLLVALGLAVALLSLLPVAYLAIRAVGTDADALAFVLRPRTLGVVAQTVLLAVLVGLGSVLVGLPVAWLTTRARVPGRRLWSVLTVVPLAVPSFVTGFAFISAFGPRGALQSLLEPLGVERLPAIYGLPGAVLVLVLATYPYVVLSVRAGLLSEDRSLEDAARTLGDEPRSIVRRITIPMLRPAIAAGAMLAVLYAVSDFGAVSLLQFDSLSRAIYVQYRAAFDRSLAAVLALLLVALTLLLTLGEARLRARARVTSGRPPRHPVEPIELGPWRWPALAFLGTVVGLALVLPAGTIAFWSLRGIAQGERRDLLGAAGLETLLVGGGAALAAAALALPIGLLLARHPFTLAGLVERATYVGFALPGVVVALAVVFLATSLVPAIYQTLFLLVGAYSIRFLPQALGAVRASLLRVGFRAEEAGRTLGDGAARAFWRITLPILRPALLSGAALVFLTVVKELPMALILAPIGFETLATQIWGAASEGFYARAATPAAVLLVLSAASVALLLRDERNAR